jgi:hypothetical protein
MKKIDRYVRSSDFEEQYKTNLKWHLATFIIVKLLSKKDYEIEDLEKILDISIENEVIENTMLELIDLADMYIASHGVIFRTVSGSQEFVSYMLERVRLDKRQTGTGIWSSKRTRVYPKQKTLLE